MSMFAFQHSYSKLPSRFYERVEPTPVKEPKTIKINLELANELGLDIKSLVGPTAAKMFSGNYIPEYINPIAMAYAGHQFGNWVPTLGDGRAILLGECISPEGIRFDIQLKGSGPTPFSRRGDGRAWLGPILREYIVSEAMHHLGIPSTRTLFATTTGEKIFREKTLPGAILTRVARSHIRVGTFQYFYARKDYEGLKVLADYLIDRIYPEIKGATSPYLSLLETIVNKQAKLIACWLGVGFIHGVMNTDNTSLSCETIDYGPCAFMDTFHPQKVFSSIDYHGRYSYSNQPAIMHWNLAQFATAILPLIHSNSEKAVQLATETVNQFSDTFNQYWLKKFRKKLGLIQPQDEDADFIQEFLDCLHQGEIDYTKAFEVLSYNSLERIGLELFNDFSVKPEALNHWLNNWKDRQKNSGISDSIRKQLMKTNNPVIIPRNHQIEQAINEALIGDFSRFHDLNEALKSPFQPMEQFLYFCAPPTNGQIVKKTFCGT